jgi:hypothetical protein
MSELTAVNVLTMSDDTDTEHISLYLELAISNLLI